MIAAWPLFYADLAILDAELTMGLPAMATAATGIDAMVHAIEAFTSARFKNPVSDLLAKKALQLLSANLLAACEDGGNREAREAMLLGATLAGQAFSNAPVAAGHALAYPLGGHFHVPHGLSNALVLIPVLRFNASAAAPLYAELSDLVRWEPLRLGSAEERTAAFISSIEVLVKSTGIPRTLREVGVVASDLAHLASDAMKQQRLLVNNPRTLTETETDALRIYSEVL